MSDMPCPMPVADTSQTRAMTRLRQARDLADKILPLVPSIKRQRAQYRLGWLIRMGGLGRPIPGPSVRTDRRPDHLRPRPNVPTVRRWCPACGCEMEPIRHPGKPRTACDPETGRPCQTFVWRLRELVRIVDASDPSTRIAVDDCARDWAREVGR